MPSHRSVLRCQAVHPRARERGEARPHNVELTIVPFLVESTHRTYRSVEDVPIGMIGVWCDKCKRASEFRVVAPMAEAA